MYIYEYHLRGLYASDDLHFDVCDTCGDTDELIGYAETKEEALNLFNEDDWDMGVCLSIYK